MEQVRFGVVGFGNIGSAHCENFVNGKVKDGILAAICDRDPVKLKLAEDKHPDAARFRSAEDMYKSGAIDAVIVAVPHYDHPGLTMLAFRYGLHVCCEKPAGVYTKQVREMNAAASEAKNLVFAMMFNQRTNCLYRKMREMVVNGELGSIRRSNWIITDWYRSQAYYDSGGWRATWAGEGGGVLINQCPHNIDLWQWICGMPRRITAFLNEGKWRDIEVENEVTAYAEYDNGATGVFVTTTAEYPGVNRFEVYGDKGRLVCEGGKLTFYKSRVSESEFNRTNTVDHGTPGFDVIDITTDGANPQHAGVLTAMTAAILRGEPLVAKGEEGLDSLMLSNAMHLSAWTGKTVELPIDEELFYSLLQKKIAAAKGKPEVPGQRGV